MTKRILSLILAVLTALSLCAHALASEELAASGEPAMDLPAIETLVEDVSAKPETTAEPEVMPEPEVTPEPEAAHSDEPEAADEPSDEPEVAAMSGTCGYNGSTSVKWKLTANGMNKYGKTTYTLTISGKGKMEDFMLVDGPYQIPWQDSMMMITRIVVQNGVTSIGDNAFFQCGFWGLSVTLPDTITRIGESAFHLCHNLQNITIPAGVKSIGANAFCGTSIKNIRLPDGITSISDGLFSGCMELTGVNIPSGVTAIGAWAFEGCQKFDRIIIPKTVVSIGEYAFSDCSGITSLDIPSTVTQIGNSAFSNMGNLKSIILPAGLTGIGNGLFSMCTSLNSINIPKSVTSIGWGVFSNCRNLTEVVFPENVDFISNDVFDGCRLLKSVTFLNPKSRLYFHNQGEDTYSDFVDLKLPKSAIIYGYTGSTAEIYAKHEGYTFKTLGPAPKNGLVTENGETYFYKNDVKQKGVQTVEGRMYYFSAKTGAMVSGGWITGSGNKRYYAGDNGVLYTGYVTIGSKSYYFSVKDAHLMKGGIVTGPGGKQYYVSANDGHAMKGGWARGLKVKGRTGYSYYYYLDKDGAVRVTRELPTSTKIGSLAIPKPEEYQN